MSDTDLKRALRAERCLAARIADLDALRVAVREYLAADDALASAEADADTAETWEQRIARLLDARGRRERARLALREMTGVEHE